MNDYKKLFQEVSEFLTASGYELLVEQVRDELATGRLSGERIQTLKEVEGASVNLLNEAGFKKSQSAEFVRRRDYSDAESVVLLLESAKRAIIDGAAMVSQIKDALAVLQIKGITFVSERSEDHGYELPVDNVPDLNDARGQVLKIEMLMAEVRNS